LAAVSALVSAALMAGVFSAFSVAVMPGLNAVPPGAAVAAMRSVNERILNPAFLGPFLLVPLAGAAAGALLLVLGHRRAAAAFLAAAAVYLLGAFLPTAAVNVPLNDALAAAGDPAQAARAAAAWAAYAPRWTAWNHVRAAASV